MLRRVTITVCLALGSVTSCSSGDEALTVYLLPSELPDNVEPVPQFACEVIGENAEPDSASVLGLRGSEQLDSDDFTELPFLRVGIYQTGTPGIPQTPEALAAEAADPGSTHLTTVGDNPAIAFTMTTAEPVPVARAALTWQQDNIIVTMLGEGFAPEVVRAVAESLEPVTREEFLAAGFDKQGCDE